MQIILSAIFVNSFLFNNDLPKIYKSIISFILLVFGIASLSLAFNYFLNNDFLTPYLDNITDSHDVVAYFKILMNLMF